MHYDEVLRAVFPFAIIAGRDEVQRLAVWLAQPEDVYAAGGSSFAVTTTPQWTLWMSEASLKRLRQQEPRIIEAVRRTAFFHGTVDADFYFQQEGG